MDLQLDDQVEDLKEGSEGDAPLEVRLEVDRSNSHNCVLNLLSFLSSHFHLLLQLLLLLLHIPIVLGSLQDHGLLDILIVVKVILYNGHLCVCEGHTVFHVHSVHDQGAFASLIVVKLQFVHVFGNAYLSHPLIQVKLHT